MCLLHSKCFSPPCLTPMSKFILIKFERFQWAQCLFVAYKSIYLHSFVLYLCQTHTIQQLTKRIELLESQQKGDVEGQITRLSTYGHRNVADFDKYTALSLAESLASQAKQVNHSKVSFLAVASQTLRSHLHKSNKVFQAYFIALFADKEYTQVLDRISKVDKSLRSEPTQRVPIVNQDLPGFSGRGSSRPQRLVCFYCGTPRSRMTVLKGSLIPSRITEAQSCHPLSHLLPYFLFSLFSFF